eukprot:232380-Amphidinium_carterae.1
MKTGTIVPAIVLFELFGHSSFERYRFVKYTRLDVTSVRIASKGVMTGERFSCLHCFARSFQS